MRRPPVLGRGAFVPKGYHVSCLPAVSHRLEAGGRGDMDYTVFHGRYFARRADRDPGGKPHTVSRLLPGRRARRLPGRGGRDGGQARARRPDAGKRHAARRAVAHGAGAGSGGYRGGAPGRGLAFLPFPAEGRGRFRTGGAGPSGPKACFGIPCSPPPRGGFRARWSGTRVGGSISPFRGNRSSRSS